MTKRPKKVVKRKKGRGRPLGATDKKPRKRDGRPVRVVGLVQSNVSWRRHQAAAIQKWAKQQGLKISISAATRRLVGKALAASRVMSLAKFNAMVVSPKGKIQA